MRIRIEGTDLPGRRSAPGPDAPDGHPSVHVGVQRRGRPAELLGLTPGDARSASWTLEATPGEGSSDLTGPYLSGSPRARFVYLSWVDVDPAGGLTMFRRAKLMIDGVPEPVLAEAIRLGTLVGRLRLSTGPGVPVCAAVRPPRIEWRAEKT